MLHSLSVQNFRCLAEVDWSPGPGRHLLVGSNGAGKTSLLEAVYFLATTRSFRTGRIADCARWHDHSFHVRGRLEGDRAPELAVSWRRGGAIRRVNGKAAAFGDYLKHLAVLSWSARDDRLVDGEPSQRRRLLDQGVVAGRPREVETLTEFRRVLSAKRRLLAAGGSMVESLDSWNQLMADHGHRLAALRSAHVADLRAAFAGILEETGIELEQVDFEYRPSPVEAIESSDAFLRALKAVRGREVDQRRVLLGPHLDRLRIRWGSSDIGRSASAGERKLFGLVLTAARQRVLRAGGREPILLLDDLDAALDSERLARVWKLIGNAPQVFMTSADAGTGRGIAGLSTWRLAGGRVARE